MEAYDEAGNVSKKVKSSITIKDVTAPDKVEGLYAEDGADETKTILRWNAPEDNVGVASYEIYIDGKKYTSKTNSLTVKKLRAGDDHTFTVIALDKAKNRSVESSGQGFSVADVTGPKSGKLVLKQRDGSTVSLESVNFSDNVGVAGYKIYLDGQEIADVDAGESGQLNYMYENANLSGKLNFSVAAYDEAGNISKTVKSSIKIKNIAAPVMLTGLVADGIDETATTFSRDIPADAVSNISKGVDVVRDWDDAWSVDDAMELTEFHNWGDGNIDAYMLGKEWTDENAVHLSANTVDWYKFKVDASDETGSAWKNGSLEIEMESDSDCSGSVTVELLDASGKVLSAKLFSACGEEEINLSSYAAGEYFIKVSASENFAGYGHLSIGYGC